VVYAIIEDGSHQYKVEEGQVLEVQLHDLDDDAKTLEFTDVLMVGDGEKVTVGQPYVENAKVTATVAGEVKGEKVHIIKYRRRKGYRRKTGHRQRYLRVQIDRIQA
jgi:large subunit ribosomal protein L21